jgi:hypothetical protein
MLINLSYGEYMNNLEPDNNQSKHFEIKYNDNLYRFVPKSNYWICVESSNWKERWVICDDDLGIKLFNYCKEQGFDMDQMLIDNKCSKRRMKLTTKQKKKDKSSSDFISLFEEEQPEENDSFVSLFDNENDSDDDGFVPLF